MSLPAAYSVWENEHGMKLLVEAVWPDTEATDSEERCDSLDIVAYVDKDDMQAPSDNISLADWLAIIDRYELKQTGIEAPIRATL